MGRSQKTSKTSALGPITISSKDGRSKEIARKTKQELKHAAKHQGESKQAQKNKKTLKLIPNTFLQNTRETNKKRETLA